MPAQRLSISSGLPGRFSAFTERSLQELSRPRRMRQMRRALLFLCALWAVLAVTRLIWTFLPSGEFEIDPSVDIINPVKALPKTTVADQVDIQLMTSWHLFGEVGGEPIVSQVPVQNATETSRDGIEEGARETRLELFLRGVVASTEDGLGHAIIEHRKQQAVYAVEDKLPVSGNVTLAKVMPMQVVLDNAGTYELLTLFDESALDGQAAPVPPAPLAAAAPGVSREIQRREDAETVALATGFRDRLYQDPQSLAQVVNVSAVRNDGALLGYRVAPGEQRQQFEQLGFREGDLVTGINGIELTDPANTLRLYQTMRTASEAVFDLERDGQAISISVQLQDGESR